MGNQIEGGHATMHVRLARGHIIFYPALLGVGILFAAFLNAVRYFPAELIPDTSFSLFYFLESFSISAIAFCIFFLLLGFTYLIGRKEDLFNRGTQRTIAIIIGCICTCVGLLFLIPLNVGIELPRIEPSLFGCFFGIGLVVLGTAWGACFSKLDPENILFNSACSLALTGILHFLGSFFALSLGGIIYIFVLVLSSTVLLVSAQVSKPTLIDEEFDDALATESFKAKIKTARTALWMPLVGACLGCFIFGLTWDPVISGEPHRLLLPDELHVWKQLLGPILASIPVGIIVLKRPDSSALRILNQAIYPIAVALLLALPTVISENVFLSAFSEILQQASFAIIVLSVWSSMASVSKSSSLKPGLIFSFCFALFALSFGIGMHLIYFIGTDGRTICLVLLTIYLALIAVSFALANRNEKRGRLSLNETTALQSNSKNYIQQRCDDLSKEYLLSPREKEVLYYLGRGYNHGYIASKLYISENTVRTHVRHIYTKLDITSREELIELIDRTAEQN